MGNIEYFANKVKAARKAIQERTATRAKFQPATVVRADQGIPVDLGRGITMELLTSSNEDTYGVIKGTLQPGENVPLHSHNEAEDFYLLSGQAKELIQTKHGLEWQIVQTGDFTHIPGNMKHAWRNRCSGPAENIIVTSKRLGRFFQEIGEILRMSGNNRTTKQLLHLSERYGYCQGNPRKMGNWAFPCRN
jgi:quercetin dioxygenase-like cupin family protein